MSGRADREEADRVVYQGWIRVSLMGMVLFLILLLLARTFLFDSFVIFTSSMEPTVVGRTQGGDRVVISRLHYQISDPARWDVALFSYENNRSTSYMKRLVGVGGEQIVILGGDLYLASHAFHGDPSRGVAEGLLTILSKPPAVQEAMLAALPVPFSRGRDPFEHDRFWINFERPESGAELWRVEDGEALVSAASIIRCRIQPRDDLHDERAAGQPGAQGTTLSAGRNPVGDLSFALRVNPDAAAVGVVMAISDPAQDEQITARIAVRPGMTTRLQLGDVTLGECDETLPEGIWSRVRLDNIDDRVTLRVEGRVLLSCTYTHPPVLVDAEHSWGRGGIAFGSAGGRLRFRSPRVMRDIYYVQEGQTRFLVPEGHYLFLGDNSRNSADSRLWRRTAILVHASGTILEGDSLGVTADDVSSPGRNPWMEPDGSWLFVDLDGHRHAFQSERAYTVLGTWPTPYVPRRALEGRGLAVISPVSRLGLMR